MTHSYRLTCWGVVPGTSLETFSQTLTLLDTLKSVEFMKVLSSRSSATALEAGPPDPLEQDVICSAGRGASIVTLDTIAIGTWAGLAERGVARNTLQHSTRLYIIHTMYTKYYC